MWDDLPDEKRELLLAYDQLVCGSCGNLRSECSDPMNEWHPRTDVCHATASQQWGQRLLRETYSDREGPDGASYLDGRWVWVSQVAPDPDADEFAEMQKVQQMKQPEGD